MTRIVVTGAPKNAPSKNKTPVATCTQLWRSFTTKKPWAETIGFTVKPTAPTSRKTRPKTFAKRSAFQCDSIIGLLLLRVGYARRTLAQRGCGASRPVDRTNVAGGRVFYPRGFDSPTCGIYVLAPIKRRLSDRSRRRRCRASPRSRTHPRAYGPV